MFGFFYVFFNVWKNSMGIVIECNYIKFNRKCINVERGNIILCLFIIENNVIRYYDYEC